MRAGIEGNDGLFDLLGGDPDRFLLWNWNGLRLLDAAGNNVATLPSTLRAVSDVSFNRPGYLALAPLESGGPQAILLDASDLDLLARARMPQPPGSSPANIVRTQIVVTIDGVIAMAELRTWPDGSLRTQVSAFVAPGTPAADRILTDGFEP